MPRNRKPLPALDNASKVNNPDLPNIYDRNYTDIILKYGGLATRFPQLETNAKTVVGAINELQAGGGGDGKHRTLTQAEYDALTEEEKMDGTIYFITDVDSNVSELGDLSDVNIYYPTNGEVLTYQNGEWINSSVSNVSSLDDLSDVDISSAQSGQVLKYDGTDWVNANEEDLSNYYTKSETNTLLEAKADVSDLPDMTDYYTKSATDTLLAGKADVGDVPEDIQDLDNVSISSASNGQVLTYNNGNWVNANASGGASSLDELSDVDITSAQSGQVLKYDGTDWVNATESTGSTVTVTQIQSTGTKIATIGVDGVDTDLYSPNGSGSPSALDDLTDVTINTPTNGQVLTYDNGNWINSNASGGATALDDLTDVSISSVTDSQVLTYDSNSGEWVNESLPSIPEDITDLSDVSVTSASNGQVLKYNNGTWENANETTGSTVSVTQIQSTGTKIATISVDSVDTDLYAPNGGGGASALDDLTDVDITTPTDGQALVYDSANSKWINGDAGTLTAEEMTSAQYALLPTPDKLDPDVLHFINDNTPTDLDVSTYYNKVEGNMSITVDTVNDTLVYAWNGGSNIGAMSVYTTAIPATVKKISFKITTGTSYSTSNDRFKVSVGVKSTYNVSSYAAPNDNDWLAVKIFNTNNSVFQDELDLSLITDPTYLYICAHGWNLTVNEVAEIFESNTQKLLYKDFNYTSSGGSGASALEDLTDVTITTPTDGQTLVYDSNSSEWVNGDVSAADMVALTQAEYDALVIAGTVDPDIFYFITDATSPVYSETVLFNTVDLFTIGTTIILAEDVDRFDEIRIFTNQADSTGASETYYTHSAFATITKEQALWSLSERAKTGTYRGRLDVEGSSLAGYTMTWQVEFTDKRTIKCLDKMTSGWQANICYVSKIVGVNYGSSFIREIIGTLTAGQSDITISSELITTSSTIEVFTDVFGVNPTNMVTTTGQVVITFPVQANDVGVKVRIS